jgi:predicted nucleic acid-binding protein
LFYLDANVFIYPVIYDKRTISKAERAQRVLRPVEEGKLEAWTSTLTWDEVVWVTSKTLGFSDAVNPGSKLLGFPNLRFIEVDETVVAKAQRLLEKYGLKPRDAIDLASALEKGIKQVISDDNEFDKVDEVKRKPL